MSGPDDVFGDAVFGYSRAQAIEDGVLVDVMQGELGDLVREAGYRYPMVLTSAAWEAAVATNGENGQSIKGRLWDVLWLMRHAKKDGDRTHPFTVSVLGNDGKRRNVSLYAVCGPGDTAAPVLTVMIEGED